MLVTNIEVLGQAVRHRRAELEITMAQLATRAGTSIRLISELERGKRPGVTFKMLLRLLTLLGLELEVRSRGGDGRPGV